ncbi:zinc finger protein 598-like [Pyrus ussuriensis x Pyrus communis]|uniref:Zinc finger protein 598-like n=1 Tax=Pyrus ussuriensis x Pyrus communis TaxID=2448454 RepID=A0A5N5H8F8_9ROSA|nr:zinc finger protein 598-like [Pyrus ussuriensis x Pyrus communis]
MYLTTGDLEVDGNETERCGFNGHPMCEFCSNPFYGDNELYMHMSTEHYTCHICQRQHPGQYEYYNNYDDLESHFSQAHFLCKDDDCLTKKFVVFATESELKRHNAKEHGGNMSRSRRSGGSSMASCICRLNKVTVLNTSPVWPATNRQTKSSASSCHQKKPSSGSGHISSSSSPVFSLSGPPKQAAATGFVSSNFACPKNSTGTSKVAQSASGPKIINTGSLDSDFPSVSANQTNKEPATASIQRVPKVGDVHAVNNSLVEKIRDALERDDNKFSAFKEISSDYRKDIINTEEYLAYVYQFGLSHLLLELARLCPDAEKQRELVETYNLSIMIFDSAQLVYSLRGGVVGGNNDSSVGNWFRRS